MIFLITLFYEPRANNCSVNKGFFDESISAEKALKDTAGILLPISDSFQSLNTPGLGAILLMWRVLYLIGKRGTLFACVVVSALVTSCSSPHVPLRGQFESYNVAYGDALNQQMLLNLARLQNGHPAYYLAIEALNNKSNT